MLITSYVKVHLPFYIPVDICCNCGSGNEDDISFYDTPFTKRLYLLIYYKEITMVDSYPYCSKCSKSADKATFSLFGKIFRIIVGAFSMAVLFIIIMTMMGFLSFTSYKLFYAFMILSAIFLSVYFYYRSKITNGCLYTQPVYLSSIKIRGDSVRNVSLTFFNIKYANLFKEANMHLINSGILKVNNMK